QHLIYYPLEVCTIVGCYSPVNNSAPRVHYAQPAWRSGWEEEEGCGSMDKDTIFRTEE
ncbi:hypothetical protein NDU88_004857, partial [Pleurodeles waltl]